MIPAERRLLLEPISQLRFTLTLLLIAGGAGLCGMAVWWLVGVTPLSRDLGRVGVSGVRISGSLTRLVEVSSNRQLPADQRESLTKTLSREIAASAVAIGQESTIAAKRLSRPAVSLGGMVVGLMFSTLFGLLWSRRVVVAERGLSERLVRIVDGDLRIDAPARTYAELPLLQRVMRQVVDESRSVTRRDVQLMAEVAETVGQICMSASSDPGISTDARAKFQAASHKIRELQRISGRFRF